MISLRKNLRIAISILVSIMLVSGCDKYAENSNKLSDENGTVQEDNKQKVISRTEETLDGKFSYSTMKEANETKRQDEVIEEDLQLFPQEKSVLDVDGISSSFVGKVGDYPIHMTLDFEKGQGSYSYDHIGKPIPLTINKMINQDSAFTLDEEGATLYIYAYSANTLCGFWQSYKGEREDSSYLEVSLQREGMPKVTIPQKSQEVKAFEGKWYSQNNKFRESSHLWIYPISDTQIYYEGLSLVWGHNGVTNGIAVQKEENGKKFYEAHVINEEFDSQVVYQFYLEGKSLKVEQEGIDVRCGSGVTFEGSYLKEKPVIELPTAQEVGIAENEEEQALFNKLVQGYYSDFIYYTGGVDYEEVQLNDTEKALGGTSYARAEASAMCYYMKTKDKMYVAIRGDQVDDDKIKFFTNDPYYERQLPKAMAEWAASYEVEVIYHYIP